jgi:type I restriction enzyme S subunit
MRANYKPIGTYIKQVKLKNTDNSLTVEHLRGIRINKEFMPSVANVTGTDLSKYRVVKQYQFAYNPMHVGRDEVLPISMLSSEEAIIVSPAYVIFEIIDTNELLPEYLMIWCRRSEFDRNAWFTTDSSVRGGFSWDNFCDMQLPVPSIQKQKEIVKEYQAIEQRIKLNEKLNQKLEETAQAIYKEWFVNFEFPDENGKPYKSSGGEMEYSDELDIEVPVGWEKSTLSQIANILMGQSPTSDTYNKDAKGEIFYQGRTEFSFRFPTIAIYTTNPKRMAKKGEILMSVRAPVGDVNIANNDCCIGRGIGSLSSKIDCNSFLYYLLQNIQSMFNTSNDGGTVFGSITKDELHDIQILKPLDDIVKKFNILILGIDNNIELKCNELKLLKKFRGISLSKLANSDFSERKKFHRKMETIEDTK